MPLYEYRCSKFGKTFEVLQKFSDAPVKKHPGCGGKVEKLISASGFQLKGSGWYATDYAAKGSGKEAKAEAKANADAKSDGKSDSKSEGKSEGKADTKSESKGTETKSESSKSESKSESKPTPAASKKSSYFPSQNRCVYA
jgi:putative FmdB family regulatory protein